MSYPAPPDPPPAPTPEEAPSLRRSTNIQGNILAAFNKDHVTFLFLSLAETTARDWLKEIAPLVAETKAVEDFNEQFSAAKANGNQPADLHAKWLAVSFTAQGLTKLSADAQRIATDLAPFEAFRAGAAARAPQLGDDQASAPSGWLFGADGQTAIDALLTLAADTPEELTALATEVEAINQHHGVTVVFTQPGEVLPAPSTGHEHFGFKDGISQPGVHSFHDEDLQHPGQRKGHPGQDLIAPGEFVLGYPNQQGTTVAVPEWMHDGSFQVYRRLAQDVPGFWEAIEQVQDGIPDVDSEKLGAKLVGRWRSGASLSHNPDSDPNPGADAPEDNDFDYQGDDAEGLKTPRFAHIRKVYPRDAQPPGDAASEARRIMRRGIPFGKPFDPTGGPGAGVDAERGLNFVCFQASIENQFEFLQSAWANLATFPERGDGPDPVIGNNDSNEPVTLHVASGETHHPHFARFVTTQAAAYLFCPSKATLVLMSEGKL